jgi:hypothetical protein
MRYSLMAPRLRHTLSKRRPCTGHPPDYGDFLYFASVIGTSGHTAALAKDWKAVSELGHKLKSSFRSVGAMRLGAICEVLEREGKVGHAQPCQVTSALIYEAFKLMETQIGKGA